MLQEQTPAVAQTHEPPASPESDWKASLGVAWRALGAAVVVALVCFGTLLLLDKMAVATSLLWQAVLSSFGLIAPFVLCGWAGLRALVALGEMGRSTQAVGRKPRLRTLGAIALALGLGLMSAFGMFIAFIALFGLSRGRQLRKRGRVLLPPVKPEGAWAQLGLSADIPEDRRAAVAARWRENGRTEHASVAAFARLTLDLMALGAPPELIASANRDALDEIRHTELCFSLAKALDGRDGGPGPFPEAQEARTLPSHRTLALAKLAVDSLIDGALNEGLSARIIAILVRRCEVPAIGALLRELAVDEARHCAHGWDVVAWCLRAGGAPVAQALRGAVAMLPERLATELPEAAQDGSWEAYGIHSLALEREQHSLCRESLTRRVEALLARPRSLWS